MSNAARRVLQLFRQAPVQGVTDVTGVTSQLTTPENSTVTPVTPVTCQKRLRQFESAASVMAALWSDENNERAAIAEYDGGAPRSWGEALARLDPARPPCHIPPMRWGRFIDDCRRFLDEGWAAHAMALAWEPLELFGCDRIMPLARLDRAGLLWLLDGRKLLALTRDTAAISALSGANLTFYRRQLETGGVLAWELGSAE
jgi:hypothetical protein